MESELCVRVEIVRNWSRPQPHIFIVLMYDFTDIRVDLSGGIIAECLSVAIQTNNFLELISQIDNVLDFDSLLENVVFEGLQFRVSLFDFGFEGLVKTVGFE